MPGTLAIVLRRKPMTETSLLLEWLSLDDGIVRAVAKGVMGGGRKPPTAFAPDLFQLCEVRLVSSRKSDLHTLAECSLVDSFPGICGDYQRTLCAAYFAALVMKCLPEQSPAPAAFDLLRRALGFLSREAPTHRAVEHFESELLRALDLAPDPLHGVPGSLAHHCGSLPPQRRQLFGMLGERGA